MQQWHELPEELMGRRKGSKKADSVGLADLPLDAAAFEGEEALVEQDFFCEACKKFFKSEQQMCVVPAPAPASFFGLRSGHATAYCFKKTQREAARVGGTSV